MRTDDEIIGRIKLRAEGDFFGFEVIRLIEHLPFEKAKEFLKPEAKPEDWKEMPRDKESVVAEMREYMDFAWSKALNHRGLSAGRSKDYMVAWLWLIGDELADFEFYTNYGAPLLWVICEKYGFPIPNDPKAKNMAQGKPCTPDCGEGCGKGPCYTFFGPSKKEE